MRAEQLTPVITGHGEGAGWHPYEGVFKVVDLLAGDLVSVDVGGATERTHLGPVVACWRPTRSGGTVVAHERGFADAGGAWSVEAWVGSGRRMNDGACDPEGRFYCGSMAYDGRAGAGSLWRIDPDRSVHRVLGDLTIPNGLVWSADGNEAFHVDTPRGTIDRYRFDAVTGTLHERRVFAEVDGGEPDGICADEEGGLWVALWGGSAVHRYDSAGRLSAVVEVGARQVTSCAFGGSGFSHLLITTSRLGVEGSSDPQAGAVFVVEPGVRGVPLLEYAG